MKKVCSALLVLFASTLVFTACKKDKDDPSIVGKWGITYSEWTETVDGDVDGPNSETITPNSEEYSTLELTADGKYTETFNNGTIERGTYRIEGNKVYVKDETTNQEVTFEFTVSETELVVTYKESETGYSYVDISKYKRL